MVIIVTIMLSGNINESVISLYPELIAPTRGSFQSQLDIFLSLPEIAQITGQPTLEMCTRVLRNIVPAMRAIFPQVESLVRLLLVNPVLGYRWKELQQSVCVALRIICVQPAVSSVLIILHCVTYIITSWTLSMSMNSSALITLQRPPVNDRLKITDRSSFTMLWLSGTVYLKTFAILHFRRHLPIYHTEQTMNYSLSPHLSFTPNLRLISSSNQYRLSLHAPFHSRFSGSLNLALFVFHITIIITVSLRSSHFICYRPTA